MKETRTISGVLKVSHHPAINSGSEAAQIMSEARAALDREGQDPILPLLRTSAGASRLQIGVACDDLGFVGLVASAKFVGYLEDEDAKKPAERLDREDTDAIVKRYNALLDQHNREIKCKVEIWERDNGQLMGQIVGAKLGEFHEPEGGAFGDDFKG
jgi:hypothetical protein